jgi:hypothetical protein
MAQIVPGSPTAGGNIGSAFGQGLSQGLQSLLNNKINQVHQQQQQQRTAQGLQSLLPNATPQEIQNLAMLPQDTLNLFVKQKLQEPGNQAFSNLLQQMYGPPQAEGQAGEAGQAPQLNLQNAGPINQKQALDLIKLQSDIEQKKEIQNLKKQQLVEGENRPYLADLDKRVSGARDIYPLVQELMGLLDTGKVATGIAGKYTPGLLQSTETQQFDSKAKELATYLAGAGKGQATNMKVRLAQESKPLLEHKPETQRALLEDALNKYGKIMKEDEARNQILAENQGLQPKNLKFKVQEYLKKPQNRLDLPANTYEDGTEVQEGDLIKVKGIQFERKNGKWEKV